MFKRTTTVLATMVAVLMAVGISSAVVGPGADDSASAASTTSPSATTPAQSVGETVQYEVGDAGTVNVSSHGDALSIGAAVAADGWSAEIDVASGREVEADFRNGDRRIQFNAELEDGEVRVRVRERNDDNAKVDDSTTAGAANSTTTVVPSTTPTTAPSTTVPSTSVPSTTAPSTTVPSTSVPSTTVPSTTSSTLPPSGGSSSSTDTYQAGDGGSVTITASGSSLSIVSVHPAAGWSFEVEVATGREVEVDFRNGTRRIQFDAQLEDGQVRVRVRNRSI